MYYPDKYPDFTKNTIQFNNCFRTFRILFRYGDMRRPKELIIYEKKNLNTDPAELPKEYYYPGYTIESEFLFRHFALLNEWRKNFKDLKFTILDTRDCYVEPVVVAVGVNGKWKMRENYVGTFCKYVVGDIPRNMTLVKAA